MLLKSIVISKGRLDLGYMSAMGAAPCFALDAKDTPLLFSRIKDVSLASAGSEPNHRTGHTFSWPYGCVDAPEDLTNTSRVRKRLLNCLP